MVVSLVQKGVCMFEGRIWTGMRKGHWVEETTQETVVRRGPVTVTKREYHDRIHGTVTRTAATIDNMALKPICGSEEALGFLDEQVG